MFGDDIKIPKSIPKKYHKFITSIRKEEGLTISGDKKGWVVYTRNLSDDYCCHQIYETSIKDVVWRLENMSGCKCDECRSGVTKEERERRVLELTEKCLGNVFDQDDSFHSGVMTGIEFMLERNNER